MQAFYRRTTPDLSVGLKSRNFCAITYHHQRRIASKEVVAMSIYTVSPCGKTRTLALRHPALTDAQHSTTQSNSKHVKPASFVGQSQRKLLQLRSVRTASCMYTPPTIPAPPTPRLVNRPPSLPSCQRNYIVRRRGLASLFAAHDTALRLGASEALAVRVLDQAQARQLAQPGVGMSRRLNRQQAPALDSDSAL